MKKDYIIYAPSIVQNHKSNGVRALHLLSSALRDKGYNAYIFSPRPHNSDYHYINKITNYHRKNSIVVYAEIVKGNPLKIKNVVRYLLNTPGKLGGSKKIKRGEVVFTWSHKFYKNAPELLIPYIDTKVFYKDDTPKTQDCVFVHKKGRFKDIPELENLVEINMNYPKTREELGNLLRSTKILYSYDNCSAILQEANACGALVKIIKDEGIEDSKDFDDFSPELFEKNLCNFIEITQNANYRTTPCFESFLESFKYLLAMIYFKICKKKKARKYKHLFLMSLK